jgi:protein-S-isoprenylcysteine O-methyltransferase Ste14
MEGRKHFIITVLQILAAGVLVWALITLKSPWNAMRYIGTALAVMGVGLVAVARYQLGKSFSLKPEAHELITHGLYSKIRNPIYVFGGLMLVGIILVVQKPVLWIVLVALAIAQSVRARREAQVLETAFGDAYREYRRKTWF